MLFMIAATLILLLKNRPPTEILLGYKKVGFGKGKFTGIGGKIEPGEKPVEAASREVAEETGILIPTTALQLAAIIEFVFPFKEEWDHRVHIFTASQWRGVPMESDEIIPRWFPLDSIPYHAMWDDCRYWLPKVLANQRIEAHITFQADNQTVATCAITPMPAA